MSLAQHAIELTFHAIKHLAHKYPIKPPCAYCPSKSGEYYTKGCRSFACSSCAQRMNSGTLRCSCGKC